MFKRKEDMKKQYINPELQVVVMKTAGMLANSPFQFNGSGGGRLNPQSGNATGDALGHGFDFDEDEDEDW